MEKKYLMFVERLRQELLEVMEADSSVVFKPKEEPPETDEDRMYLFLPENGVNVRCGIYPRELYQEYLDEVPLKKLVEEILQRIQEMQRLPDLKTSLRKTDYDDIQSDLLIRPLSYPRNQRELEGVVYDRIGDIALVLYQRIGEQNHSLLSMKIREPMLELWNQEKKTVMERAMKNTCLLTPPRFYDWKKLKEQPGYEGEPFLEFFADWHVSREFFGNCLSTASKINGAVAVFYPGVAKKIAAQMNSGFYMVFTSIHEVMIHSDQTSDPDELRQILRDTIKKMTPPREVLTYRIYHYDKDSGEITWN